MKSIKRVRKGQPATKKKVVELEIGGMLGRWYARNHWGAFTCPLPFLVLILYWTGETPNGEPDGRIRVHEFVHVKQDEHSLFFLVSWVKYFWAMWKAMPLRKLWRKNGLSLGQVLMESYQYNAMEVEAYDVEWDADDHGLPSWAL